MHILYIQTVNGAVVNHPAYRNNLLEAFGSIPDNWEPFVRVDRPSPTQYQVNESEKSVYTKINGVWTDVWLPCRNMTMEEITVLHQAEKDKWALREQAANWATWIFDEATCKFLPPISKPEIGNYKWSGADNNWREAPSMPETGGPYKFDFTQWAWVAV